LYRFYVQSYKEIYKTGYDFLSPNLKQTASARKLELALESASALSVGAHLPSLEFTDLNKRKYRLLYSKYEFTIVDFWYSRCAPCVQDFQIVKSFYDSLKRKNIRVVAVSTDLSSDIPNWKKMLSEKKYPWIQLLDENGKWCSDHSINSFPYNIIVDRKGKIVAKNLSPGQIESEFLRKKNVID
jgi:alkyl hydroperoxide reductase subunit AhpC